MQIMQISPHCPTIFKKGKSPGFFGIRRIAVLWFWIGITGINNPAAGQVIRVNFKIPPMAGVYEQLPLSIALTSDSITGQPIIAATKRFVIASSVNTQVAVHLHADSLLICSGKNNLLLKIYAGYSQYEQKEPETFVEFSEGKYKSFSLNLENLEVANTHRPESGSKKKDMGYN